MARIYNRAIREIAKESDVYLWEIAEKLGMHESAFSRMLRHELPDEQQEQILEIINSIVEES